MRHDAGKNSKGLSHVGGPYFLQEEIHATVPETELWSICTGLDPGDLSNPSYDLVRPYSHSRRARCH